MRLTATITDRIFRPGRSLCSGFWCRLLEGGGKIFFTREATDRGTGMPPKISSQNYFCFLVLFVSVLVFGRGIGRHCETRTIPFFRHVLFFGKRYGYDGLASHEKRW